MCLNMGSAAPLIMGKQLKAIATLSRSRSPAAGVSIAWLVASAGHALGFLVAAGGTG